VGAGCGNYSNDYISIITARIVAITGDENASLRSRLSQRRSRMAASGHQQNKLLASLDAPTFGAIESHLSIVQLELGQVLADTHAHVQKVYFPHAGIISCVVELVSGGAIETGMIGKDGQFGGGPALDHKISSNYVIMQVQGGASLIDADRLRSIALERPNVREMILRYELFFLAQVQQTAACNAAHDISARTCKWLLRMQKLAGDDLFLTQEFLAQMMGVRRTSVTEIAKQLQRRGMISYSRGHVRIRDLAQIQERACECDEAVNSHYTRIVEG
jgi:CRP-like cAMP-binding protein